MSNTLSSLSATLSAFESDQLSTDALARLWRQSAQDHMPPLPTRYMQVLEHLLIQLESAALFTEESCSFSRTDMVASLRQWLTKAQQLS